MAFGYGWKSQTKIFTFIVVKSGNFYFRVSTEATFYWILLKIGINSAKDIRKNIPVFQAWEFVPAQPTPHLFRVVLLNTELKVWRLFGVSVYIKRLLAIWHTLNFIPGNDLKIGSTRIHTWQHQKMTSPWSVDNLGDHLILIAKFK